MENAKKITVEVPEILLKKAQIQTNQGITETVRQGLKLLAEAESFQKMVKLKGKEKFDYTWEQLKQDR